MINPDALPFLFCLFFSGCLISVVIVYVPLILLEKVFYHFTKPKPSTLVINLDWDKIFHDMCKEVYGPN